MRLLPKKKISDEQISLIGTLGEKVGKSLRGSKRWRYVYLWMSAGGRRHTKTVSVCLLLFSSVILLWGIYSSSQPTDQLESNFLTLPPSLEGNVVNYDDSIRHTQEKIDALLLEAKTIGDSIQTLLSKGKISRAESIYVIDQTAYLSELKRIINK
jgi:hypothetical protein